MKKFQWLFVVLLLGIMFVLGLFSLMGDSGTTDEVAHIPAGYSYWKYLDYRLNPEHPPLIKLWDTLSLLFVKDLKFPTDKICWTTDTNGQWECGWEFIYRLGNDADKILLLTRIPVLILALLLGLFIYRWSRELWGWKVGLVCLFFYALSPNILAHSRLVTTDLGACATFFFAIYYFYKFIKKPQGWYLWASGIFFGIAQLAKFSNILLIPYMLLLIGVLLFTWRPAVPTTFLGFNKFKKAWLGRLWMFSVSFVLICIIGFAVVGATYAIFTCKMPVSKIHQTINDSLPQTDNLSIQVKSVLNKMADNKILRPYAYYGLGLRMVFARVSGGNTTYFLGQTSNQSWWYFYPISFLIKTTLVVQILLLLSLGILIYCLFKKAKNINQGLDLAGKGNRFWNIFVKIMNDYLFFFVAITCMAMFMLVGVLGNLNIGLRHVLGMWPFMIMICGWCFSNVSLIPFSNESRMREIGNGQENKPAKLKYFRIVFGVVLILWYIGVQFMIWPYYLAYYNELVGGYKNGYKYSVDSNTDWGQDLKRLAKFVDDNNIKNIKVDYFGGSQPVYYMGDKQELWRSSFGKTTGWLAVSATYYQNSKYYARVNGEKDYSWLEKYKPVAIIGGSILVYNIPEK